MSTLSVTDLVTRIKTHIEKGDQAAKKSDQHYVSAGQYLHTLKDEHTGSWQEWEDLLKAKVGIGKSRASELMQIADGRKAVADVRGDTAKRMQKNRKKGSPSRDGETDTGNREQPSTKSASKGNGSAAPTEAADTDGPNLQLLGAKLKADAAAIAKKREQEEREKMLALSDNVVSNVVALHGEQTETTDAVAEALERAAQAEADAEADELKVREAQAQAAQKLPGTIDPLKDGALTKPDDEPAANTDQNLLGEALVALLKCFHSLGSYERDIKSLLSPKLYKELRRQHPLPKSATKSATKSTPKKSTPKK